MTQKKIYTIRELRAREGLTLAAFAKKIGVGTSTVGAYETGKIMPSEKVAASIKEVFNADVEAAKKPGARKAKNGASVKNPAEKKPGKKPVEIIIQSPLGGSITPDEIAAKVPGADTIYVRVDENKAYWVRGEETGSADLW